MTTEHPEVNTKSFYLDTEGKVWGKVTQTLEGLKWAWKFQENQISYETFKFP